MDQHPDPFDTDAAKRRYGCDAYFVDLSVSNVRRIVSSTHFWFGLWSHRKRDYKWKGFLEVDLAADDGEGALLDELEGGR
ncbi:hypothetical protein WMF30_07390 [Sorangium sp. So ce134]